VYDVGVIGISDERLGEIVGAVISVKSGESLTEEIMIFIEGLLPKYKRPAKSFSINQIKTNIRKMK
jgi:fatty-acyl-CoA synthase